MALLEIRKAENTDMERVLEIYAIAREFMKREGNGTQWGETYPSAALLRGDILKEQLYTVRDESKIIRGVFAFIIGEDVTYGKIDGAWLSDSEYGTIHRIASDGSQRGIFSTVLSFCEGRIKHLRIDTHERNLIMQHLIEKHGFVKCGIIYTHDGTPRIAYEKAGVRG